MGFGKTLTAIGQSNLIPQLNQVANTAINLEQMQQQQAHNQILEQQSIEQNNLLKLKRQQEEKDMQMLPFDETLDNLGFTRPAEKEFFKKHAQLHLEDIGGSNYIQRGTGTKLMDELFKDPAKRLEVATIRHGSLLEEENALKQQLSNPEVTAKLKPEQLKQMQDEYKAKVNERAMTADAIAREKRQFLSKNPINPHLAWDAKGNAFDLGTGEQYGSGIQTEGMVKEGMKPEKMDIVPAGAIGMKDGKVVVYNPSSSQKDPEKDKEKRFGPDMARLMNFYQKATKGGRTPSDVEITGVTALADSLGYDFKKIPGKEYATYFPGTNFKVGKGKDKDQWVLLPKGTQQPVQSQPLNFNSMPDASQYPGYTMKDNQTGRTMKSVNGKWVPAQ